MVRSTKPPHTTDTLRGEAWTDLRYQYRIGLDRGILLGQALAPYPFPNWRYSPGTCDKSQVACQAPPEYFRVLFTIAHNDGGGVTGGVTCGAKSSHSRRQTENDRVAAETHARSRRSGWLALHIRRRPAPAPAQQRSQAPAPSSPTATTAPRFPC